MEHDYCRIAALLVLDKLFNNLGRTFSTDGPQEIAWTMSLPEENIKLSQNIELPATVLYSIEIKTLQAQEHGTYQNLFKADKPPT